MWLKHVILHKYKVIYFDTPKVACSSIRYALADLLEIQVAPQVGIHARDSLPHVDKKTLFEEYKDYFKFSFVRNPWDRLLSCYSEKIRDEKLNNNNFSNGVANSIGKHGVFRGSMSFEEFVDALSTIPDRRADPHLRSQYALLSNESGELFLDFIGRFENLEEDFDKVCHLAGMPKTSLPHKNQSPMKKANYIDYYTDKTKNFVSQRYAKDIEVFEYKFN